MMNGLGRAGDIVLCTAFGPHWEGGGCQMDMGRFPMGRAVVVGRCHGGAWVG